MITVEEAKKQGLLIAGMEQDPNFVISSKSAPEAEKNINITLELEELLNNRLQLKNYTNIIHNYTIICLILPPYNGQGVDWKERKYFKRKEKKFFIDIRFPEYERFCNASKQEALQIMAEQTLRGTKKYLSKVKDFDFDKFYTDLVTLFKNKKLINNK